MALLSRSHTPRGREHHLHIHLNTLCHEGRVCRVLLAISPRVPFDASGSRASRGSMVKMRMSSLDVRAMVLSLQQTVLGYRVSNVYDINPRTYLLKLAKPDAKLMLLIESGIRVHTTEFVRDKGACRASSRSSFASSSSRSASRRSSSSAPTASSCSRGARATGRAT